jgi:hypothetical protein
LNSVFLLLPECVVFVLQVSHSRLSGAVDIQGSAATANQLRMHADVQRVDNKQRKIGIINVRFDYTWLHSV